MNQTCPPNLLSLTAAAQKLGVPVSTLLSWNENNILKPTITLSGEVGYREDQVNQFLAIQQPPIVTPAPQTGSHRRSFGAMTLLSFTTIGVAVLTVIFFREVKINLQTETASVSGSVLASQPTPSITLPQYDSSFTSYAETAYFSPEKDNEDSVFDSSGNIKGKTTNTDVLAAAIGANGTAQNSSPVKLPIDLSVFLVFIAIALLSFPFIFKKPGLASSNPIISITQLPDSVTAHPEQKILEVNQKTDGTVVLSFQNQEYKVSKPELDSESDQFIERLMSLFSPGVKEIDYDSSKDGDVRLSAPLSKLVTRLGFVGVKRDLFFPRTSKNRVLFRRYLTQDDLTSMKLNPDQLKNFF